MKRGDFVLYVVCLVCLLICMYALGVVKDAENRCDARYAPYMEELYNSKPDALQDFWNQINLTEIEEWK